MPMAMKKKALLDCGCGCGDFCKCCPGWPQGQSATVYWTTYVVPNDCEGGYLYATSDFGCEGSVADALVRQASVYLYVRIYCDIVTRQWKVQYRSPTSGGGFETPASAVWTDAINVEFICPDCVDAVDGIATGSIHFFADSACESSGGPVPFQVECWAVVEVPCPDSIPAGLSLTSGDNQSGDPSNTDYTYTVLQTGNVTFIWSYVSSDTNATYDPFGYLIDGAFFQLSNDAGALTQSGTQTVFLSAGQIFGWRQRTVDNVGGSATTTITIVP